MNFQEQPVKFTARVIKIIQHRIDYPLEFNFYSYQEHLMVTYTIKKTKIHWDLYLGESSAEQLDAIITEMKHELQEFRKTLT